VVGALIGIMVFFAQLRRKKTEAQVLKSRKRICIIGFIILITTPIILGVLGRVFSIPIEALILFGSVFFFIVLFVILIVGVPIISQWLKTGYPEFGRLNIRKMKEEKDIKGLLNALCYKIDSFETKDKEIREDAVKALIEIGDSQTVSALISMVNDRGSTSSLGLNDVRNIGGAKRYSRY
jgi:hypothetical protein